MWDETFCRCESLLQHCEGQGDEYHTATAFYLRTLFKKGMQFTQAAVHHGKNDQSRKAVDANEPISGCYYHPVDIQESDHVNKVNENVETGDIVGDLVVNDDLEMNDASTSIEQQLQVYVGPSDHAELDSGQELPGQRALDNEGVNGIDKATDANGDPSEDSDHTIDAENTTPDEPDSTLDSGYGARIRESKSNAVNLILRLFLYHILHTMSL
jgi:hypothetical protein